MKLKTLFTTGLLILGAPFFAQADLSFDTDGLGGAGDVITLTSFDWAPDSFLAEDGNLAIVNWIGDPTDTTDDGACSSSCEFTVYTHGTLAVARQGSTTVWSPTIGGIDENGDQFLSNVEVTYTLSFTEEVTGVSVQTDPTLPEFGFATADFAVVETAEIRFEMYIDTSIDADALTGSGYSDGTLILYGNLILDSTGSFKITTDTLGSTTGGLVATENLDQSTGNDYDGQLTIPGTGSQGNIEVGGLIQDDNYFLDTLAAFGFDFTNLSQELPFTTVDPSDCFNGSGNYTGAAGGEVGDAIGTNGCNTAHVNGTFEQNEAGAAAGTIVPVTSDVNGFPTQGLYNNQLCDGIVCPDFVAQTDPNSPVEVTRVPEPGILALIGMGLGVLGMRRRRRS